MTGTITTGLMAFFLLSNTALANADVKLQAAEETIKAPVYQTYNVAMTGYNAVPGQTDDEPEITASGVYSDPDLVVARSVDLADELPFGTVIEITDTGTSTPSCGASLVKDLVGLRVVADSMHPRKRNQVDILFAEDENVKVGGKHVNAARALGMCKNIGIRVVGKIDIKQMPKNQDELKLTLVNSALAIKSDGNVAKK